MIRLGVNIDHVATIRQARRGLEPDPVWAAVEAELGGADGITFHVREDRRHMQDDDVRRLRQTVAAQLNFELALADDVISLVCEVGPNMAMLVPEKRQEVTTEGGLNVADQIEALKPVIREFENRGIRTSAFIDADPRQVEAAAEVGFEVCEIHTGPYAVTVEEVRDLRHERVARATARIAEAGALVRRLGMQFNAGHGLNYRNVQPIAAIEGVAELHIGHSIVSRSVFVGMREAVREMKRLMVEAATNRDQFAID